MDGSVAFENRCERLTVEWGTGVARLEGSGVPLSDGAIADDLEYCFSVGRECIRYVFLKTTSPEG